MSSFKDSAIYVVGAALLGILSFLIVYPKEVCAFFGDCVFCGNFHVKQCVFWPNPKRVTLSSSQHTPIYENIVLKLEGIDDGKAKTTIIDTRPGRLAPEEIGYKPVGDIVDNAYDGCNLLVRLIEISPSGKATFEMQCR